MIKLIFTSALLVGSLFFFQSNLPSTAQADLENKENISSLKTQKINYDPAKYQIIERDGYIELHVMDDQKILVVRKSQTKNT